MKKLFLDMFIRKIILWLTGLTNLDFQKVVDLIKEAEKMFDNGADRAKWVKDKLVELFAIATPFILNLLVEMAVAYAKDKGYIH
jgi:hypothetical protein